MFWSKTDHLQGVDLDLTAGGMFETEKSFGSTTANVKGYWIAFGFTWRCGPIASDCCETCVPETSDPIQYQETAY
jgi:hypothetical protein